MKHDPKLMEALTVLLQGIRVTASVIERLIADTPDAVDTRPSSPSILIGAAEKSRQTLPKKWSQVGTDWPQIGGNAFEPSPRDIFMSPAYRAAYQPGEARTCYVGRCQGLERLSNILQMPLNKLGTCDDGRLFPRVDELAREQYGSLFMQSGNAVAENGFDRWSTYQPSRSLRASPNSPVIITQDALGVIMPASMSKAEFDERYDGYVAHGSLGAWIISKDGTEHCARVGTSALMGLRYTRRLRDRRFETELAKELVIFRARADYERLVAIIERVVVDHLRLLG